MGTHGAVGTRARVLPPGSNTVSATVINSIRRRPVNLSDWPVARRLFAVIVAALLMGVIFGGLRVTDAESDASQLSRVTALADLGEKLTILINDMQNERDGTILQLVTQNTTVMQPDFAATDAEAAAVRQAAAGIGGLPVNIQNDVGAVLNDILPARITLLQKTLDSPQDEFSVIGNYGADINDMITLANQVAQGVSDASLAGDVQAYNALALAKEQASEQRALVNFAFVDSQEAPHTSFLDVNLPTPKQQTDRFMDPSTEAALSAASAEEYADEHSFQVAASPADAAFFSAALGANGRTVGLSLIENFEGNLLANDDGMPVSGAANSPNVPGSPLLVSAVGLTIPGEGSTPVSSIAQARTAWDKGAADELDALQSTEQFIAGNIAARANQLQQAARQTALTYGIITVVVLLIVLLAALAVARSLVLPLRRLRVGALNIASVQLPERVRLLSESPDAAATMSVAPINVVSNDEIGEVARAFDQVHAEAVRLAGEQALLRASFNAMFVNLSRRSQSLIERLARMIDNLEQNEADPERLGSLFSMDHLVTRMRRNSENLLLLAGHENPSKWTDPVPLADVARAAISEIEQYNRVVLNIQSGISVIGNAVSDVAHLLAELVENATIYSPKDTRVQVLMQELSSGGVLIEIIDKGIGVSETRLAEMNWRLDNPPTIDVSVSRHMGLFAVARLAERHRIRVRLRPAEPQGLSALVWLPDGVIERTSRYSGVDSWQSQTAGVATGAHAAGGDWQLGGMHEGSVALASNGAGQSAQAGPRSAQGWFRGTVAQGNSTPTLGSSVRGLATTGYDEQTSTGLPVRSPRTPGRGSGTGTGSQPLPQRSPDQARSRLAGFQRGTRRAEIQPGPEGQSDRPPRAGEGSER